MKQKLLNSLRLRATLLVALMCTAFAGQAWGDDITYTFSDKDWKATVGGSSANWSKGSDGNAFTSGQGIQVTTGTTGANGTSPASFTNISKIVVTYNTNKSAGAGSIGVQIGTNSETSNDVAYSGSGDGRSANYTTTFNYATAQTGNVKITVNTTTNSIWLKSVTITYSSGGGGGGGSSVDAPSFSPGSGAVAAGTTISLIQASADAIRYTTDGSDPSKTEGTEYSAPIEITTPTTIKAIAIKGDDVSSVSSATYTISVTAPEFNLASSGYFLAGTDLTLTSAGNTIFYNITTNGDTPLNPTNSSTEYTGPIALSSGTVKIKAIAYDSYGNASSVASRTVNGVAPATLPFSWAGGAKADLTALTGVIGYGLGSNYAAAHSPYLVKFDGDGDYIEIFTTAQPLKVSVGVKMIGGGNTTKIKVQESTNGVEFSDVEELTISGSSGDIVNLATTEDFASTTRVIKLLFAKGSGDNVGVGPISILGGTLSATLNGSGYATFASSYALDFSDDSEYSAWQVTAANSGTGVLTFSQITGTVAAGTGVLLKGTASATINIPVVASGSDISATNKLEGITAATAVDDNEYYGLSGNTFKKVNAGTVPAGKALLPASKVGSVKAFTFVFEDEATGIQAMDNVQGTMNNAEIYNLAGQRLSKLQKGVNIVNGKKILVK